MCSDGSDQRLLVTEIDIDGDATDWDPPICPAAVCPAAGSSGQPLP